MVRTRGVRTATAIRMSLLFRGSGRGRHRFAAQDGACLRCVRSAFDGRLGYQHRVRDRLLLYRRLGAAEDRTVAKEDDPSDVPEFPRHVSLPAESFVEVPDKAILPYHLFFGGNSCGKVGKIPARSANKHVPCRRCGLAKIG